MSNRLSFNKLLLTGVAFIAFGSGQAYAQTVPTNEAINAESEVVVVTGVRLQNRRAVDQKRLSDRIVDSITADEVGALPDFSIAEAVTRIAGVSYEGRNGDAEFVVIRGLRADFNYLQIDGAMVPSTRTNGRATQLSVIPSYIIRTTDVVKSFTADLDANSIGGQLSVRTLSAFDQKKLYLSTRAALGYFDNNEAPVDLDQSQRFDLAFANRFGSKDQFGVVFGANYSVQDYQTWLPGVGFNEYRFVTATNTLTDRAENAPDGAIRVPTGIQAYQYTNNIERTALYGKLEWRPSDTLQLALSAYQFEEIDIEQRWDTGLYPNNPATLPTNLTATTGTVAQAQAQRQYFLQGDTNVLRNITLQGSWLPSERQEINFLLSAAEGERENPFYQVRFEALNRTAFAYSYENSGRFPVLTLTTPSNWQNDALFTPTFYRPRLDTNTQDAAQVKLDYGYNVGRGATGWGVKAGLSYRSDERVQDQVFDNDFRPNSPGTRGYSFANVRDAFTNNLQPQLLTGQPQILIDPKAFLNFYRSTSAEWRDAFTPANEALSTDFSVEEAISAAFIMGRFATDNLVVLGGLRYEKTDLKSQGYRLLTDTNPATPLYPLVSARSDYDNLLPSINAKYEPFENAVVRAAYSKTLGRGEYSALNVNGNSAIDDVLRTVTITSGNPDLKPRLSENIDISFEYYLPKIDGVVSLGVFNKEIENEIFTRSTREEQTINGVVYTVTSRRPENANSASLSGFEFGVSLNSFKFIHPLLSDFGFNGNYAQINSSFEVEMASGTLRRVGGLLFQPEVVANATLFWAPGDFEARIAYRFSDEKQQAVSATSPTFDEFFGDEERVDVQARYRLANGVTLFVEGRNLTDTGEDQILPYGPTHQTRDYGRSFWVGVTYKR